MNKNRDLYSKDSVPPLARPKGSPRPAPSAARKPIPSSRLRTSDRHDPRRRHHSGDQRIVKRKRKKKTRSFSERLLWVGLLLLLLGYFGFLGWFLTRSSESGRARAEPAPEAATADAPAGDDTVGAPDLGVDYTATLADWSAVERLLSQARDDLARERPEAARKKLEAARERVPGHVLVLRELGGLALQQEQFEEAESLLREGLAIDSSHAETRHQLARALLGLQAYDEVISVTEWILEDDEYSLDAHRIVADAYLELDQPRDAIPHLRRIATLDGADLMAENRLAHAHSLLGHYDQAVDLYESVLEKDPDKSVTYFHLAACHARQDQSEAAIVTLKKALPLFGPSYITTWLKSEDFDLIRQTPSFQAFTNTLVKTSSGA